jgi:CTP synthase
MWFSGVSPDDRLVEYIELRDHPWFVATQAHPELKSRPSRPHPLFREFVGAAAAGLGLGGGDEAAVATAMPVTESNS